MLHMCASALCFCLLVRLNFLFVLSLLLLTVLIGEVFFVIDRTRAHFKVFMHVHVTRKGVEGLLPRGHCVIRPHGLLQTRFYRCVAAHLLTSNLLLLAFFFVPQIK